LFKEARELAGADEHAPVVQVGWHEAGPGPFLEELDHNELAPGGAIDRVIEVDPAGLEDASTLCDHTRQVSHVFEDVTAVDHVETAIGEGQGFAARLAIVDAEAGSGRVRPGRI
jgi:hypothetical protein